MKRSLLTFICLLASLFLSAQQLQKVPFFLKERKDSLFYEQQRSLWAKETKKNPKNEEAWLSYFMANRALGVLYNSNEAWERQPAIFKGIEKAIPGTFTYHLMIGWGGKNKDSEKHIEQAYAMQPSHPLIFKEVVVLREIKSGLNERKDLNKKWFESGDCSPYIMNYMSNLLLSLDKEAILFTFGDLDTYPIWMLQDVKLLRVDVAPCNMHLLRMPEYRQQLFKRYGIRLPETESAQFDEEFKKGTATNWSYEQQEDWNARLIKAIAQHNPQRPVYVSLTGGDRPTTKLLEEKLYLTGLASKFSEQKFDNLALMRKNYEQNYLLDYLTMTFSPDASLPFVEDWVNQNYIPSFIKLHNHYLLSGETEKAAKIRKYIELIAKRSKDEQGILKMLN